MSRPKKRYCKVCGEAYYMSVEEYQRNSSKARHQTCGLDECVRAKLDQRFTAAKQKKENSLNSEGNFKCRQCGTYFKLVRKEDKKRLGGPIYRCCTSIDCISKSTVKFMEKRRKAKAKTQKQKDQEAREKLKSITVLHRELRTILQKIARHIDKGLPCICTGDHHDAYDGGHFFSAGAYPQVQHNLHNIHKCSVVSNRWRSGDENRYRYGLIDRYGQTYFDAIDSLRKLPPLKISREEIIQKKKIASTVWNEMKNEDFSFATSQVRVRLRNKVNEDIGIYTNFDFNLLGNKNNSI